MSGRGASASIRFWKCNMPIKITAKFPDPDSADRARARLIGCGADGAAIHTGRSRKTRRTGDVVLDSVSFEDLRLELDSAILSCGGDSVQLSRKEFEVLRTFLCNPTMTIPTETLLRNAWGLDSEATGNNVEVYISFLRKKLRYLGSRVSIRNFQRIGYRLEVGEC